MLGPTRYNEKYILKRRKLSSLGQCLMMLISPTLEMKFQIPVAIFVFIYFWPNYCGMY